MLFGKSELCLCIVFGLWCFSLYIFTLCLSYCLLDAESDESLLGSWSNFCRLTTPGKVHNGFIFSIYFFHNGSYCVSLQFLINGFATLSRLIETAVDRGMMRFILRLLSLLYFVLFSRNQWHLLLSLEEWFSLRVRMSPSSCYNPSRGQVIAWMRHSLPHFLNCYGALHPAAVTGVAAQALGEAQEPLLPAVLQAIFIRRVLQLEPVIPEPYFHAPIAAGIYHNTVSCSDRNKHTWQVS